MLLNNRYQVIRLLGEGGFGKTFLAQDRQMPSSRSCVIKQLKPITTNPDIYQLVQERFQREAAVLETLGEESSQIPRLYAYFSEDGLFYLVQEWIEGETLDRLVQAQGCLDENTVRQLLLSLLPVLAIVHRHHMIHRDIKPENIILRQRDRNPVLIDFGAVREAVGTVVTAGGTPKSSIVIGTPGFMASEQAIGRPIPASDLYSLGLTAIYLLTGKSPHQLGTDAESAEIIWRPDAPDLSAGFAAVLDRAIRSHPRDRYNNAQDMLDALQQPEPIAPTIPSTILPPSPLPPSTALPSATALPPATLPPATLPPATLPPQPESNTMRMAPTQPTAPMPTAPTSQPHQNRSPVWLGSLIAGGLISAAILVGFLLIRSPLSGQFSSGPTPATTPSTQPPDTAPIPSASPSPSSVPVDPAPPAPTYPSPDASAAPSPDAVANAQPIPAQDLILRGTSTGNQVNIYAAPSTQSESPHYGLVGDRVTASRQTQDDAGSTWYFVQFASGASGWVRSDFVQPASAAPQPDQPPDAPDTFPKTGTLTGMAAGSRVNVRSAPSTQADSPHYGLVGDRVTVLAQTQGGDGYSWYQVRFASGAEGWVRGDFVQLP